MDSGDRGGCSHNQYHVNASYRFSLPLRRENQRRERAARLAVIMRWLSPSASHREQTACLQPDSPQVALRYSSCHVDRCTYPTTTFAPSEASKAAIPPV